MDDKYIGVWAVFDEDYEEGLETAFARYKEAGIKHVMYAGIAHVFEVHDEYYSETCIDPRLQIDYEEKKGDIFGTKYFLINSDYDEIRALAQKYGLNIGFDITPGVSDPIVDKHPSTAVVDVEGRTSGHWMCPSNPDVRKYFCGRIEDILIHNNSISEVELDVVSMDFYDPQVVPDWVLPELYPLRQLAAGNCFCEHCVKKAERAGLNVSRIKQQIRAVYGEATTLTYEQFKNQADTMRGLFDIIRFVLKYPELMTWLRFRCDAVSDFVKEINVLVKNIAPNILLSSDLVSPSFSWAIGQWYGSQHGMTDLTKLMLYHKNIGLNEVKPLKSIKEAVPGINEEELMEQYYRLKGFTGPDTFDKFSGEGIDVENIFYEVKKAKLEAGSGHKIVAGLGGDPPASADDVKNAVEMAYRGGADGYMLHLWYHNAPKENIVAFGEHLRKLGEI